MNRHRSIDSRLVTAARVGSHHRDRPPPTLYRVDECPDLVVDSCLCDQSGQLVFLSLWGRDTAVQEFLARLTLAQKDGGLTDFHLLTDSHDSLPVSVGSADRLQKRTTRTYRQTLFGSLLHVWLFDPRCVAPDKANGVAFAIVPKPHSADEESARLWQLIRATCSLPLLDHWRGTVLDVLTAHQMLVQLSFCLGPISGYQLRINTPVLTQTLGDLIRSGGLTVYPVPERTADLRHAA